MNNSISWFEDFIIKVLKEAGHNIVAHDKKLARGLGDIDIITEKNENKYCVEVKFSRVTEKAVERINYISSTYKMIPLLITATELKEKRSYYHEKYSKVILIDITNLLYALKDNVELYNELVSRLPYSIEEIEPQQGFIEVDSLYHDDHTEGLIKQMELCQAGKDNFSNYEKLCIELLKNIFADDLALWKEQQKSNNDLYRFDLLCRIKDGNQKSFWTILEKYFNSKYIIFEFKNYTKPITQKEIYTTEKYLYKKALRSVAIIIAAKGYDDNALWASKGCLRENGKLILLLSTKELIIMNKMHMVQDQPCDYMLDKLDEFLMSLEK